jgi:hypothetical protein
LYPSMDKNKKPILDSIAKVIEKNCEKEKKWGDNNEFNGTITISK